MNYAVGDRCRCASDSPIHVKQVHDPDRAELTRPRLTETYTRLWRGCFKIKPTTTKQRSGPRNSKTLINMLSVAYHRHLILVPCFSPDCPPARCRTSLQLPPVVVCTHLSCTQLDTSHPGSHCLQGSLVSGSFCWSAGIKMPRVH